MARSGYCTIGPMLGNVGARSLSKGLSVKYRPTYANVVSTLALVVALGGTGAYAAGLAKDSVKSKQIKNGAVKTVDIKDNAITGAKIANGSVAGAKIQDGSITADDIAPSVLARANNVHSAVVKADGTLVTGQSVRAISAVRDSVGNYIVSFDRNVRNCAYVGDIGLDGSEGVSQTGEINTVGAFENVTGVYITTYTSEGALADRPFHLAVIC
jgi:hypothetical protein